MKFPPCGVGLTSNQRVTGYPVTAMSLLYHWAHLPRSVAFSMDPAPRLFGQTQKPHPCMASSSQLKSSSPTESLLKASTCGQRNWALSSYIPCQRQMVKLSFEPGSWQAQAYNRLCVIVFNWSSKTRGQKESAKVRKSFLFSWSMLTVQLSQIVATCSVP